MAGTGAVLLGLGGALRAMTGDLFEFMLASALFAIGHGLVLPNLPKAIRGCFPKSLIGTASGLYLIGFPLGTTIATGATPLLAEVARGWRGALVTWGAIALLFSLAWWITVRDPPASSRTSVLRISFPSSVVRNIHILILSVIFFISALMFVIEVAWFPTLVTERGVSELQAGFLVSTLTLGNLVGVVILPALSDRLGLRLPFLWVPAAASALGLVALIFVPASPILILLPVLGFALAGPFTMTFILPGELVEYVHLGAASGIVFAIGWSGIGVGSWLAGFLRDLSGGFLTTLYALVISALIIITLSNFLPETGKRAKLRNPTRT